MLWVFALVGFWHLVSSFWRWLLSFRFVPPQIRLLFLVKDNQETVEGLFRQLALDCHFRDLCSPSGKVMVFDLGSQDQTLAILQRLAREFSFLHLRVISEGQVGQALQDFDQGILVLDLRVLPVQQALAQARHLLQRTAPLLLGQQPARQGEK
mgnify:FL=1